MKLYTRREQEVFGPYSREEIFAFLREGRLVATDEACREDGGKWGPLMEVLMQSSAASLFSVEQIAATEMLVIEDDPTPEEEEVSELPTLPPVSPDAAPLPPEEPVRAAAQAPRLLPGQYVVSSVSPARGVRRTAPWIALGLAAAVAFSFGLIWQARESSSGKFATQVPSHPAVAASTPQNVGVVPSRSSSVTASSTSAGRAQPSSGAPSAQVVATNPQSPKVAIAPAAARASSPGEATLPVAPPRPVVRSLAFVPSSPAPGRPPFQMAAIETAIEKPISPAQRLRAELAPEPVAAFVPQPSSISQPGSQPGSSQPMFAQADPPALEPALPALAPVAVMTELPAEPAVPLATNEVPAPEFPAPATEIPGPESQPLPMPAGGMANLPPGPGSPPANPKPGFEPAVMFPSAGTLKAGTVALIRPIKLPVSPTVAKSDLWVADLAPNMKAVLVIVIGPNERPEVIVKDKEWQEWAIGNGLGLAAINGTLKAPKAKPGAPPNPIVGNLGWDAVLLGGLRKVWDPSVPLIVYGRSGAGTLASNFAVANADHLLLWAAYANEWQALPAKGHSFEPGLVICDRESARKNSQARDFFARGRTAGKPWAWLSVGSPWKDRAAQIDKFFRAYTFSCLAGPRDAKAGVWLGNTTLQPSTSAERMGQPGSVTWLPHARLVKPWSDLMPEDTSGPESTVLQRAIATKNPAQPELKMYLRLPATASEKKPDGVLAYCTWESDERAIVNKLSLKLGDKPADGGGPSGLVYALIEYAESHNLALLTWGTATAWNNQVNTEEMEAKMQREFSRNFDLLSDAWVRGVKEFGIDTGIPQKDFLLYGISRGAQWAHRLAIRKPEYFLAVHVHVPSTFDKPLPSANGPLWLVTTGELEYGYERAKTFYGECKGMGYPMIFKAFVGLGHAASPLADALGVKFFDYALSIQDQHDEHEKWRDRLTKKTTVTAKEPWLKDFTIPAFYGDIVNQEAFPLAQAQMVPLALRVPLPNKVLAEAWNK